MGIQATQEKITEWERKGLIEPLAISGTGHVPADRPLNPNPFPKTGEGKQPAQLLTTAKRKLRIRFTIPIRTTNESNTGGRLPAKLARKAATKAIVAGVLPRMTWETDSKLIVRLTRNGVRKMDDDGVQSSLKVVRDCIAAWIGRDDGDESIRWIYHQRPAWIPSVLVEVAEH